MRGLIPTLTLVLSACLSLAAPAAFSQDRWPDKKPIRLIVSFTPGGSTDIFARLLAQKLTEQLGTTVLVDNRAGAEGNIGNEFVARSAPDGHTLLFNTSGPVLSMALGQKLSYDLQKDFMPVSLVASVPLLLASNPELPVKNVTEFIDHLKANPGKLAYGSAGTGNITHLGALMIVEATSAQALHVPYKGAVPALMDVVGGRLQFSTSTIVSGAKLAKSGQLRALAVTGLKRSRLLPDVPAFAEIMPGFEVGAWYGVLAPAKTPPAIVQRLSMEIRKALQDPAVRSRLEDEGAEVFGTSATDYDTYISKEITRWSQVAQKAGLKNSAR